jgi:hypothetical protein
MAALSAAAGDMAHAAGTRAVATQQRSRALALMGDRKGALRAIGDAEDILAAGQDHDPDLLYFYGPAPLRAQRGLILAYLAETPGEHARAADLIVRGVEGMPPPVRDSEWLAWYRVRAAYERAVGGEVAAAVAELRDVTRLTGAARYGKTWSELVSVVRALTKRWPDDSDVAELDEALR